MSQAIRIHAHGGPEALSWEDSPVGEPGEGEALVRHTAIGVNFLDVYHRTGLYPLPLPAGLGVEAAGVVEKTGPGVTDVVSGDRVAYVGAGPGAYSERRVVAARFLVKLPAAVDDQTAAAVLLKGMTAEYLLRRTRPVKQGETILFHAAAGGVGLLACRWAKKLGATVIGTVGTRAKAEIARENGCDQVIVTADEDFVARVKEITKGQGVPVVYDSVGKDTFLRSLDCLSPRGLMVSFGQSSGPIGTIDPLVLSKGALFLTRPTLHAYTALREELVGSAGAVFVALKTGQIKVELRQTFALKDAAEAHRALESRKTVGSTVLLP